MENHRWRAALTFGLTLSALSVIFTWFSWAQLADGAFFILLLWPHFFFNTLANLHSLIEEDPHKAQQFVESLSQYLHRCLPYVRPKRIALADELVVVQQYVAIQNIRFEQRIRLQLDIASGVQFTSILPMTLLTLVENAIKHGLSKTNGGNISIGVEKAQAYIWLRVTDDADQLSAAQHGTGLANLVTRLQLRYGDTATLQLQRLCHGMTEALIRIPCDD